MTSTVLTPVDLNRKALVSNPGKSSAHAPLIVDLRPARQFNRSHIPGSQNISRARLLSGEPPQRDLILVSERGQGDAAVAADLHENGFHRRIEHLEGGVLAWSEAGLPLVLADSNRQAPRSRFHQNLREPWLLSLLLLAVAITLQQGGIPLVASATLLWLLLATTSLVLQRGSKQLLRRYN